jgi:hypothetical protein
MDQAIFDSAQRAYDNQSDPHLEDDGTEREKWEQDIDLTDILDGEVINQLLWDYAAEDSLFKAKLDEAFEKYRESALKEAA